MGHCIPLLVSRGDEHCGHTLYRCDDDWRRQSFADDQDLLGISHKGAQQHPVVVVIST